MPITRRTVLAAAAATPSVLLYGAEKPPLRYLQIGTGHPHANKIGVYRDSPDWQVVGVVEEDPKRRADAKKSQTYRDIPFLTLEEGLNSKIDAVGIETEVQDLLKYCELAINAGFHCHLDKPAGESLDTYKRIVKKADANGLTIQMGYMYRFNPAVQMLHRCLEAGWLGTIFETHAVMSKVLPASSRRTLDDFEGGIMFELGCHIVDLTVGVLGKPDKVSAFPRRTLKTKDDTLVDNMLAVFEYPEATATVRSTGLEVDGFGRRHFTVCGTEGTFHIQPLDRPSVTLSLSKERKFEGEDRVFKRGKNEIPFEPPYSRYVGDADDLAKIIRGEKDNPYPSAHDLAVQETVLRASAVIR